LSRSNYITIAHCSREVDVPRAARDELLFLGDSTECVDVRCDVGHAPLLFELTESVCRIDFSVKFRERGAVVEGALAFLHPREH
jgi:hypothetical protein